MAAQNPYYETFNKWQTRQSELAQQGIPQSKYSGVMAADLRNVQGGGTPLSRQEVQAEIDAATGHPLIGARQPSTSIAQVPKSIPSDITGLVTGFLPALGKFLYHLPSETRDTGRILFSHHNPSQSMIDRYGLENAPHPGLGQQLRNFSRVPLLNLLPGLHTAAGLTSASGRQQLRLHPVATALDVMPVAAAAGRLGALGRIGLAGEEGAAALGAASRGQALEALSHGNVPKALFRAAGKDVVESGKVMPWTSARVQRVARSVGVSHDIADLAAGRSIAGRVASKAAREAAQSEVVGATVRSARQIFIDDHIMPATTTLDDLATTYTDAYRNAGVVRSAEDIARDIKSDYRPLAATDLGLKATDWPSDRMIANHLHTALLDSEKGLLRRGSEDVPKRIWNKGMHVYRVAVLTGPRHLAHVTFGGLMFMAGEDPMSVAFIARSLRKIKAGEVPAELTTRLVEDIGPGKMGEAIATAKRVSATDGLFHMSTGRAVGRILTQIPGALNRIEEHIADTYRVSVMLAQEARGASTDAAVELANKVFVDMDHMTPFERQTIRNWFPFYAFTKHLFRYLFRYPIDHPYRAAIVSRLSDQFRNDWGTGLPQHMMNLFTLGPVDSKGNVTSIDLKSLNPFRSFVNDFTMAGISASINPYAGALLEQMGVNTLSGSSDPYPDLTYDPFSGQMVAKRPNFVQSVAQQFIPEFGAIDHFLGLSSRLKALRKAGNHDAYMRQLFSSLNLPFAVTNINPSYEQAKAEKKRLAIAQKDVSAAIKSGDPSSISGYSHVPYGGSFVPPEYIQALLTGAAQSAQQAQSSGQTIQLSPRDYIPRVRLSSR